MARQNSWQLARDLIALEKRIARKLTPEERTRTFGKWYKASVSNLDATKTHDQYLAKFLAGLGKVRVPTGEGEALKAALARISNSPFPQIPGLPNAAEPWRKVAALHRELARQSANGIYFLSCRDAAKADGSLNKDSANIINNALVQLRVILPVRIGEQRPGGRASEFRYLLSLDA
jgi:hypothetical protein